MNMISMKINLGISLKWRNPKVMCETNNFLQNAKKKKKRGKNRHHFNKKNVMRNIVIMWGMGQNVHEDGVIMWGIYHYTFLDIFL